MPPKSTYAKDFVPDLTRGETVAGWVYLPIHVFLLPLAIGLMPLFWPWPIPSAGTLNVLYGGIGVVYVALFFRKYLRRDFDRMCDRPWLCVTSFAQSFCLWYLLMMLVQLGLSAAGTEMPDNPNDNAVMTMLEAERAPIIVSAVFLAPIVEEVLFRGVVFQSIRKKHRVLAYAVSVALFALMHVWQYAVAAWDVSVLLYALQYVPITLALTWAYERSGSLWTAIFFHMFNNALPFFLTAAG